jgi:hypothetical protein
MEYTFYKIICLNPNIDYLYIGSTKDLIKRKWCHKSDCNNVNKKTYNIKLYEIIRNNGGWDNWEIKPIGKGIYNTRLEARIEEQKYINELNSNLNSFKAMANEQDVKKIKDEYVFNNHQKVLDSKKKYRDIHKEELKQKYKANIELQNKRKEKINCDCGGCYTYSHKAEHLKSKKHTLYIGTK